MYLLRSLYWTRLDHLGYVKLSKLFEPLINPSVILSCHVISQGRPACLLSVLLVHLSAVLGLCAPSLPLARC